jgi:hypothetical protein
MDTDTLKPFIKDVFVGELTMANSAFGTTSSGESVFINARIIEALKVQPGDTLRAFVIPNYEDKKDRTPWRAVRCAVIGSMFEDQPEALPLEEEVSAKQTLQERIVAALEEHGPLRTATMSRLLGEDSGTVGSICLGLFAEKKIAMAEVFSEPNQSRASHRVWGLGINDFDVDPFEE